MLLYIPFCNMFDIPLSTQLRLHNVQPSAPNLEKCRLFHQLSTCQMIRKLPDNCVLSQRPYWKRLISSWDSRSSNRLVTLRRLSLTVCQANGLVDSSQLSDWRFKVLVDAFFLLCWSMPSWFRTYTWVFDLLSDLRSCLKIVSQNLEQSFVRLLAALTWPGKASG